MNFISIISVGKKSFFFFPYIKVNYFVSCMNFITLLMFQSVAEKWLFFFSYFLQENLLLSFLIPLWNSKCQKQNWITKENELLKMFCKTSPSPSCFTDWKQLSKNNKGKKSNKTHQNIKEFQPLLSKKGKYSTNCFKFNSCGFIDSRGCCS